MSSNLFRKTFDEILKVAKIIDNPSQKKLREMAKHDEKTTNDGNPLYISKIRSRSAKFTKIVEDPKKYSKLLNEVKEYLKEKELIKIDQSVSQNPEYKLNSTLLVSKKFAKLAFMWNHLLFKPKPNLEPSIFTLSIPEWPETKILADPDSGVTISLGTDYAGEVKMATLRTALYKVKQLGGIGLHAGSKSITFKQKNKLVKKGIILFGLSATGKTTLTCHNHYLNSKLGEGVEILQDDIVFLWKDGYCSGSEKNFYVKTQGIDKTQPLIYNSLMRNDTIYENVKIKNGEVDFNDVSLTKNGRAIINRSKMKHTTSSVDLEKVDIVIFITRREQIVPPIAKLNYEQAAAFFMLGESIETSAGDPTKAGKSIRVVGTNPFIIGPKEEEGNRFYELIKKHKIQCYLLNTGSFGKNKISKGEKIKVKDSATLILRAAKDELNWVNDDFWEYEIPREVKDLNWGRFNWKNYYSTKEYKELNENLRAERSKWLKKFPKLNKNIKL